MTSTSAPKKRLRHRIPVRLRHYWKLVVASVAFVVVLAGVFGTGMIRPYTTSAAHAAPEVVTQDIAGTKDLFDTSVAHDVRIDFNDANYQKMLEEYFDTGEKDYLAATMVIDGTTIENVGMRLKGNSTLGSLTWNGQRREGGPGGGDRPGGGGPPGDFQPPEGMELPEGFPQQGGGMGGMGGELKAEEPESLPWPWRSRRDDGPGHGGRRQRLHHHPINTRSRCGTDSPGIDVRHHHVADHHAGHQQRARDGPVRDGHR